MSFQSHSHNAALITWPEQLVRKCLWAAASLNSAGTCREFVKGYQGLYNNLGKNREHVLRKEKQLITSQVIFRTIQYSQSK